MSCFLIKEDMFSKGGTGTMAFRSPECKDVKIFFNLRHKTLKKKKKYICEIHFSYHPAEFAKLKMRPFFF